MGDAAHTAHFAIGSGTKLALEDAIELTRQFRRFGATPDKIPEVLAAYEEVRARRRRPHPECGAQRHGMVRGRRQPLCRHARARAVHVFAADALAAHQPRESAAARQDLARRLRALVRRARRHQCRSRRPRRCRRCSRPIACAGCQLQNRIVISPMAMYSAADGVPNDFHLVHLGSRALGGAGLIFGEMTCVSPDARITPGCLGLWNDEQAAAWKRIVEFVHATTGGEDRPAARPCRPQGLDPRGLGRHRSAARRRQLAADLGVGASLSCRTARCRAP